MISFIHIFLLSSLYIVNQHKPYTRPTVLLSAALLGKKYQAMIYINGKTKHLGSTYDTAVEAALVVDREAIKLRRPFNKLNFPDKAPDGYTPLQQVLLSCNKSGYRGNDFKSESCSAKCSLVIIVRIVFIGSFLFYCLFLNHSFTTNPKQDD